MKSIKLIKEIVESAIKSQNKEDIQDCFEEIGTYLKEYLKNEDFDNFHALKEMVEDEKVLDKLFLSFRSIKAK